MVFDWDGANITHIARHGVMPEEAEEAIHNEPLDAGATLRNGETRTAHLGMTNAGRTLFIVMTEREGMYRVVTARDAHKKERIFYLKHKEMAHEQDSSNT